MARIEMRIREGCEEPYVEFHVDGVDLAKTVKEAFPADSYVEQVLPLYGTDYKPDETVIGETAIANGLERALLFACGCGCYACGGLFARVIATPDTITWSDFGIWCQCAWMTASVPPIVFDRKEFVSELDDLKKRLANWRPPPPKPSPKVIPMITPPPLNAAPPAPHGNHPRP